MSDVTLILSAIQNGESCASEQLLPLVYEELRKLAMARMTQERPEHTLQATALVHEAYLRLVDSDHRESWENRAHFFAAAAESMRRILVDHARKKKTLKHGGDRRRVDLENVVATPEKSDAEILQVHESLEKLALIDERKAQLVKLRFFAGFTIPQAADVLGISHATAERDWTFAKTFLYSEIEDCEREPD